MNLNIIYESAALAAPQSFRDGIAAAAAILNSAIRDNIVVSIALGYAKSAGQALPDQTTDVEMDFTGNGTDGRGLLENYSTVRAQLASHATAADDASSIAALPTSFSLQGQSNFLIGTAQAKALGVVPATAGAIDGQIGIGK